MDIYFISTVGVRTYVINNGKADLLLHFENSKAGSQPPGREPASVFCFDVSRFVV